MTAFLHASYDLIQCDLIQIITLPTMINQRFRALVIDDCGKLKDGWLFNNRASWLYNLVTQSKDPIAGNALLFDSDGSDILSIFAPDTVVDILNTYGGSYNG